MLKVAISESPHLPAGSGTAPCVAEVRRALTEASFEVVVFPATGGGGRELERALGAGLLDGVLDLTLSELADELVGGTMSAGPDRLTAAALHGIPQVVVPGALDAVRVVPAEVACGRFSSRVFHQGDPNTALVRTTPAENDRLGHEIALKVSAARGPAAVVLPLRGLSSLDREGGPFWRPEADCAIYQSVRNWISPHVRLVEMDLHVNDPAFARSVAAVLLEMLAGRA
jgi:uncharacterized protein (UPF0261 family)